MAHFASQTFDVVFSFGLLETLPHAEMILQELLRVVKQNGAVCLSVYRGRASLVAALDRKWYEGQLFRFYFDAVRVIPLRPSQDVLIARRKQNFN